MIPNRTLRRYLREYELANGRNADDNRNVAQDEEMEVDENDNGAAVIDG